MLQHLLIKDLAIVSQVDVAFFSGMTVITGETGAGKSILLDALNLVLGQRSESHMVRNGAERAEIAATFDVSSLPGAILWLADLELTCTDSPQQCIIRRILYANGRTRAFINGCPATTSQLRLLGEYLVQIHGQHQHQLLLKAPEQLRLLDAFGQHETLLSQVKTTYKEWDKIQQRLQALKNSTVEQARVDLLQYQSAEIQALHLSEHELPQLYKEHDQLAHAQEFIQSCEHALGLLDSQDGNALQLITQAQLALRSMAEKFNTLTNAKECLANAQIQLQEATSEINQFVDQLEIDPTRLAEVEHRLERIHDMARKHRVEPQNLLTHYQQLQEQIQQFTNQDETILQLTQDLQLCTNHYQRFARELSHARLLAAKRLAQEVTECIQQLGMPGALFTVDLVPHADSALHALGNETVVFGISANPGHPPLPLNKVASGGELSRISLALELITAKFLATPCLIFDEVDVGISGKIGAIVGKSLYDLSQSAQVLCITHLPQVASCGDHHIQVAKTRNENTTISHIQVLNKNQRIEEIARMLGGLDITSQARAHAKQLLRSKEEITSLIS